MVNGIKNNNLITQKIADIKTVEQNTVNAENKLEHNTKQEIETDTFELSDTTSQNQSIESKSSKGFKYADALISGLIFAGIMFIPELIMSLKRGEKPPKVTSNFIETFLKEFNDKTERIITLEKIDDKYKYKEILVLKNNRIVQRVLIKLEDIFEENYVVKHIRSYKGEDLYSLSEINANEEEYLFKEFKRSDLDYNPQEITIKRKNKPTQTYHMHTTSDFKPVMRIENKPTHREYTAFLYDNDECVGIDRQIVSKDKTKEPYNIITLPQSYLTTTSGERPYDSKLLEKILYNF